MFTRKKEEMKFSVLAQYMERLENVSSRVEMTDILAELLYKASSDDIDKIIYFSQGQLVPSFKSLEIGMSEKLLIKAISEASNKSSKEVESIFNQKGDLGSTAESLLEGKEDIKVEKAYKELIDIAEASGKGSQEQKINLLQSLLRAVTPLGARYISRFVLGRMRLGIGDPTVLEALAQVELSQLFQSSPSHAPGDFLLDETLGNIFQDKSEKFWQERELLPNDQLLKVFYRTSKDNLFNEVFTDKCIVFDKVYKLSQTKTKGLSEEEKNKVKDAKLFYSRTKLLHSYYRQILERAYNLCSDLGLVATTLKKDGIKAVRKFHVQVGYPVRMALCERLPSGEDIIKKIGEAAIEAKYDGFRLQIHKDHEKVEIFSRNLERLTPMFPEITEAVHSLKPKTLILEGEALAHNEDTGELLPFQVTIQRRRKHDIDAKAKEFPLKFFVFELLYLDGEDYTDRPYEKRRKAVEKLIKDHGLMEPARMFRTDDPGEIHAHFEEFVEVGLEGIVAKRLDSPYAAGARNYNWIKLKRSYKGELADTVDVCIVGYYRGKGQRARFGLGALLAAVYEPASDSFKTITRIGTGFTEEDLANLKKTLDEIALKHRHPRVDSLIEPDVWVEPRYVVTVTADEITRSPMHTAGRGAEGEEAGYALRFPRAMKPVIREDKSPEDANTVEEIIKMAKQQKKVKIK